MFENPRRGRQARNFTTNFPKILDLKSSSEQIFSENCRWVLLKRGRVGITEQASKQKKSLDEADKDGKEEQRWQRSTESDLANGESDRKKEKFPKSDVIPVIIAFFIIIVAILLQPFSSRPDLIFANKIMELQSSFTNQTDRFWRIIKNRGLAHLRNASPPQP